MPEISYPTLYRSADLAAARFQRQFLALVAGEYILLIVASAFLLIPAHDRLIHVAYAVIFVAAIAFLSYRTVRKPEQSWSLCRAVAEQVKSYTWRYVMRVEPFDQADKPHGAFRDFLRSLLAGRPDLGAHMAGTVPGSEAITTEMEHLRAATLKERRDFYRDKRLADQLGWYTRRAIVNKRASSLWVAACIAVLLLGLVLALLKIVYHYEWERLAIEPLIIVASSILGWIQANKYGQLAATYTMAAHETGLFLDQLDDARTEDEFAQLVDEAETAFSRENHQWVVKQVGH